MALPQWSSTLISDFPWNKPSSYWGSAMAMETHASPAGWSDQAKDTSAALGAWAEMSWKSGFQLKQKSWDFVGFHGVSWDFWQLHQFQGGVYRKRLGKRELSTWTLRSQPWLSRMAAASDFGSSPTQTNRAEGLEVLPPQLVPWCHGKDF